MRPHNHLLSVASLAILAAAVLACPSGAPEPELQTPAVQTTSLETALAHGDEAYRHGDYDEAQKAYEEALAVAPDNVEVVSRLGKAYFKNRQSKKVEDLLKPHLEKHPEDMGSRVILARTAIRQGHLDEAADQLREVLRAVPDSLMAHYNLGYIEYKARNYDKAEAHIKRSIELNPKHPEAHYTYGLLHLAQRRYEEAAAEFEEAVAIDPRHVKAHFNLANAYARLGRMEDAQKHQKIYFDMSSSENADVQREEQFKSSCINVGRRIMENDYEGALEEYIKLKPGYPDYAPLYGNIGKLQLQLGRRQEALDSLRQAVQLDPRVREPHYLLSNLYQEMGDAEGAARERQIFATLETIPERRTGY